ncbi:hypothetical protein BN971_03254 [Mycobacterium bohemicum DSM 44277]|uniref:Uncharacterized protein n=1 Tax=Mycobacterium bohemicum DSM 44277 TaxID=1236609 RepID=A0A0U0W9V7_MYCBE|nr:hypothetical protein [Mycobacterium bohemicum]MCV6968168.1 hypothetical protein [Mycobacterium bohemicum]CPR11961.1 hypothetical protein BN971_03254 [Mycobacterium bohemicum DSM 44277]
MTPENASNWRDLADQLTPEQVTELEDSENGYRRRATLPKPWWSTAPRSDTDIARLLIELARQRSAHNIAVAMIGDVAPPPAAVKVYDWDDADTPDAFRRVDVCSALVKTQYEEISVELGGVQTLDGSVEYQIRLPGDTILSLDEAGELAAAINAAISAAPAKLDGWTGA